MECGRGRYLKRLIDAQGNGLVKIVTGIRRCGKTYLLFNIFHQYLIDSGVPDDNIICISLDDTSNDDLLDPKTLTDYVKSKISGKDRCFLLIDEVQEVTNFSKVLNGFLKLGNIEIYVTGSNSRYLSNDVMTEFRGRGYPINLYPLSFSEFLESFNGTPNEAFDKYLKFGGLPGLINVDSEIEKRKFLLNLVNVVYLNDIKEHHNIKMDDELVAIINILASSTGSLTNATRITNTINTEMHRKIDVQTVNRYMDIIVDSFMFEKVQRYDLKGRSFIGSLFKFYPSDIGLRNAQLNFRQMEKPHLMESAIYTELRSRGFEVDVGVVETRDTVDGKQVYRQLEIDFIVNDVDVRYYIQSSFSIENSEKRNTEMRPFRKLRDGFKRILVTADPVFAYHDDEGVLIINIVDFLMNQDSLDL